MSIRSTPHNLFLHLFVMTSVIVSSTCLSDNRQTLHTQSPDYLYAVGKLSIPSQRYIKEEKQHFIEHCSATLLADRHRQQRWLMTAWHCLENYRDLGKRIRFSMQDLQGTWHERDAFVVAHGGSMEADWALLSTVEPLPKHLTAIETQPVQRDSFTLAGYSGDAGLGQNGSRLTYQEDCKGSVNILDAHQKSVDCWAFKGASGGAVLQNGKLVGVISQGNNLGTASFVSHAIYANHVARKLP